MPNVNGQNRYWRAPEGARRPVPTRPWVGLGVALVIVLYVLVFGDAGWLAVRAEQKSVDRLRAEVGEARAQTEEVRERTSDLLRPGSPELERIAREQFRMRGQGEEVYWLTRARAQETADGSLGDDSVVDPEESENRP